MDHHVDHMVNPIMILMPQVHMDLLEEDLLHPAGEEIVDDARKDLQGFLF